MPAVDGPKPQDIVVGTNMKANILQILVVTLLGVYSVGCASIGYQRGLSISSKAETDSNGISIHEGYDSNYTLCGEGTEYLRLTYTNALNCDDLELSFRTSAIKRSCLLFGPSCIIPLPLIPWPFGMINSIYDSSPNDILTTQNWIYVTIATSESCIIDPGNIELTTDLGEQLKQTWYLEDNGYFNCNVEEEMHEELHGSMTFSNLTHFSLSFDEPAPDTKAVILDMHLNCDGNDISIPPISFDKSKGLILTWHPSFNG